MDLGPELLPQVWSSIKVKQVVFAVMSGPAIMIITVCATISLSVIACFATVESCCGVVAL
jgi:hypothetical protein